MSELSIVLREPSLLAAVSIAQAKDDVRHYLNYTRIEADGRMVATDAFIMTVAKPEKDTPDYSEWAALVTGIDVSGPFRTALKNAEWLELRTMPDTTEVMATVARSSGGTKTFAVPSLRNTTYPDWHNVVPHGELPRADGGFVAGSGKVWAKAVATAKFLPSGDNMAIGTFRGVDHGDSAAVLCYGNEPNILTVAMPFDGAPTMFDTGSVIGGDAPKRQERKPEPKENPDNMPVPHRRQAA